MGLVHQPEADVVEEQPQVIVGNEIEGMGDAFPLYFFRLGGGELLLFQEKAADVILIRLVTSNNERPASRLFDRVKSFSR